nr:1-phosphatidylinositol-3-phosphate 5-kinase FAB1B-like [Ipomoea batatas]
MFMGTPENYKLFEIVGALKSWIPKRGQPANMPRDFWMPDQSCRVCYDCDSPFTVFNRRHHCRLCGRVFCAKCASNSIPVPSELTNIGPEDGERIRVCNYCFKQQKQGIAMVDNATSMTSPGISPSPSTTSLVSSQSSCTCNSGSSVDSTVYSTGSYLHVPYGSSQSSSPSAQTSQVTVKQDQLLSSENPYSEKYGSSNRNNDEDYDYSAYRVHSNPSQFCTADVYYDDVSCNEETLVCRHSEENVGMNCLSSEMLPESIERKHLGSTEKVEDIVDANNNSMEDEDPSIDSVNSTESEPVDFENNGLLWLPPEPEDEEDEREALLDDDDDNGGEGGSAGEWGYLSPSRRFADGEYRNREKSSDEHKRVIKNIVDGHFKALIGQLLKAENLSIGDEDDKESWLEIITALSWEAATFLKPDMSQSEGMDPGAYVKVKCIPCGHFTESVVVKGVVCKKNVAHRRMTSKIDKPRLLILGGALEYQRVTNHLSSFDTLLQQEKDHLMMAVAKIDAHHPNILLVEKTVSRFAQECLLAKDISLVLNVKRPLLQRIARCTGANIVPSVDNLATQKLGYCDSFRVEKFVEEYGKTGHDGRKLMKTLMFFEGCPKPLGCTILLKGANVDELKKVKHVVQYGVFAAYHLALETSFLADEGASLPDLPLKSPIKVSLPDKPPSINSSITLFPGFTLPVDKSPQGSHTASMSSQSVAASSSNIASDCDQESYLSKGSCPKLNAGSRLDNLTLTDSTTSLGYPRFDFHDQGYEGKNKGVNKNVPETSSVHNTEVVGHEDLTSNCPSNLESLGQLGGFPHFVGTLQHANMCTSELVPPETDNNHIEELEPLKEEFTHLPSDPQSILVSLSTRCVWKQSVCERARLFRIKYYGSFDLPLGRFLRDHLFDQNYRCHSCEMPSEAHVHCYTHQQGSLTISVKKLPNVVLPGEREGKIWMWHRCMQCPRINGFPPATRRVVMSDAARGLSFGKFLELSFSNHAAASRVAGCGHSLHKDCLRFYGFGKMVACFRYAPINVHSVFLPPQKLEFNHDNQEWIHKEVNEVCSRAENLFVEVFKALHKISEQISVKDGAKAQDSGHQIAKLERILEKEKKEFEVFSTKRLLAPFSFFTDCGLLSAFPGNNNVAGNLILLTFVMVLNSSGYLLKDITYTIF